MIEAVNSAIAAVSVTRSLPEQGAQSHETHNNSLEAAPSSDGGVRTPFISPVVYVNTDYDRAVLQLRDSETGDVVRQIPTDNRLAAQQRATLAEERAVSSPIKINDSGSEIKVSSNTQEVDASAQTSTSAAATPDSSGTSVHTQTVGTADSGDSAGGDSSSAGSASGVSILA